VSEGRQRGRGIGGSCEVVKVASGGGSEVEASGPAARSLGSGGGSEVGASGSGGGSEVRRAAAARSRSDTYGGSEVQKRLCPHAPRVGVWLAMQETDPFAFSHTKRPARDVFCTANRCTRAHAAKQLGGYVRGRSENGPKLDLKKICLGRQ
jgi:hypothetical protein